MDKLTQKNLIDEVTRLEGGKRNQSRAQTGENVRITRQVLNRFSDTEIIAWARGAKKPKP